MLLDKDLYPSASFVAVGDLHERIRNREMQLLSITKKKNHYIHGFLADFEKLEVTSG